MTITAAAQETWNTYLYGLTPSEFVAPFNGDFDAALESFLKEVYEDNVFDLGEGEFEDRSEVECNLREYFEGY